MDQESFRLLLQTPRPGAPTPSTSRGSLLVSTSKTKSKAFDPSQPAFKPRKVKKAAEGPYRDRAAERRGGEGNDYAQVEAVLEDFEKRTAGQDKSTLDAQRRYLGGDGAHSVLVKGLDLSLLEQNKARAAALSTADDDASLEQAFLEAARPDTHTDTDTPTHVPKKRTRADLLRELKEKRSQDTTPAEKGPAKVKTAEEEALLLEQAKQAGKFRPIGFKSGGPVAGAGAEPGKPIKKKKAKAEEGEQRKKKRKVVKAGEKAEDPVSPPASTTPTTTATVIQPRKPAEPEAEPLPVDFDIFADAGEYEGLQLDDDSDSDSETKLLPPRDLEEGEGQEERPLSPPPLSAPRRWIDIGSPEPEPAPSKPDLLSSVLPLTASTSAINGRGNNVEGREEDEEEEEEERPARLVPLASSALPSIKDFLAMEKAASKGGGKRRKREAGGGDGEKAAEGGEEAKKRTAEAKADRDYKRLKSYTDKKAAT